MAAINFWDPNFTNNHEIGVRHISMQGDGEMKKDIQYSGLPNNILENIILRLSIRNIFVCKCVRKTWYDCGHRFDPTVRTTELLSIFNKPPRTVGALPYFVFTEEMPLNGCLYWGASKTYDFGDLIIHLSLLDYSLTEVSQPPNNQSIVQADLKQDEASYTVIAELNLFASGVSLGIYWHFDDQSMWVLKEEKDGQSALLMSYQPMWVLKYLND